MAENKIDLEEYVKALPSDTPKQLYKVIKSQGYIGQEKALKAMCVMAYKHVRRLKKIYVEKIDPEILPKKQNCLLLGPTGCGKTFLVELLFKDLLGIPTVIIDITNYSETGYVGQDVASVITRLIYAAEYNPALASIGIVCIDEIDKLSSGQNAAVFSGAGTTKDVSGMGVQRELLKMLETAEIPVPTEISHNTYQNYLLLSTRDIAFIGVGAFSGFKFVSLSEEGSTIGFNRDRSLKDLSRVAVSYSDEEVENVSYFQRYGFLPELIARFNRIIPFHALSHKELSDILKKNVIQKYVNDFKLDEIELVIDKSVTDNIINKAIKKETGARGLESTITHYIEDASFEAFSKKNAKQVVIKMENNEIKSEVS